MGQYTRMSFRKGSFIMQRFSAPAKLSWNCACIVTVKLAVSLALHSGERDANNHEALHRYSAIGREFGRYGIEAFLETRAILE